MDLMIKKHFRLLSVLKIVVLLHILVEMFAMCFFSGFFFLKCFTVTNFLVKNSVNIRRAVFMLALSGSLQCCLFQLLIATNRIQNKSLPLHDNSTVYIYVYIIHAYILLKTDIFIQIFLKCCLLSTQF